MPSGMPQPALKLTRLQALDFDIRVPPQVLDLPMSDSLLTLKAAIERLSTRETLGNPNEARRTFLDFRAALTRGEVRAADKVDGHWVVNAWVKQGILLGFRLGELKEMSDGDVLSFVDKDTFPARRLTLADRIRLVPGGSSIREGAYVAPSVICMPPMFINVGAYLDEGSMIDSHALVGSCAQIGKRVHLSAAAQIGGVLEPAGAMPVIIEDDVIVGGNCGVYEGTIVRERVVLASGVIITGSTPVFDLVRDEVYRRTGDAPLEIPAGAVVVPGARAVSSERGLEWGLSLYAPVIVKYRDEKTDAATQLEEVLR